MEKVHQRLIEAADHFHMTKRDTAINQAAEALKTELEKHRRECGLEKKGGEDAVEEEKEEEEDDEEYEWRCRKVGAILLNPVSSYYDLGVL